MATTEEEYEDIKQQCITTFTWEEAEVPAFPQKIRSHGKSKDKGKGEGEGEGKGQGQGKAKGKGRGKGKGGY